MLTTITTGVATVKRTTPRRLSSIASHSNSEARSPMPQVSIHGAQKPIMTMTVMINIRRRNSIALAPTLHSALPFSLVECTIRDVDQNLRLYSQRNAMMGSVFIAARAGKSVATNATNPSSTATATKLMGSCGPT